MNGNKTRLNLGVRRGMNRWEWKEWEFEKKTFERRPRSNSHWRRSSQQNK